MAIIAHTMIATRCQSFLFVCMVMAAITIGPRSMGKDQSAIFVDFGANRDFDVAADLKEGGVTFLTGATSAFLVPDKADEVFEKNLEALQASALPMMACNGFIRPKHLRCVGEEANHDEVLKWAETAFRRLKQANGRFMVFGSGGSRNLRNGWPAEKANRQFVELLKRLGPLAQQYGITVVIEQLNARECNYITRIGEAADLVRKAKHPNVRLCADLYHMAMEGDTPEDLKAAMDVVAHVEIAEKEGRAFPSVGGQDFRPYFRVLRDAGYCGAINIEAKGTDEQIRPAVAEIKHQAAEVMAEP